MTEMQDISLPTPAIVIAAGNFAVTTAAQIRNIYLRGDPRRKQVTDFFSLSEINSGSLQIISLDAAISKQSQVVENENQPVNQSRKSIFQETLKNIESLKIGIEQALYDIRSHELLIKAGWAEEYDVPVNIYLIADIKDPFAAGAILPISCLLQDITENSNLCKAHALFNTAVFPRAAEDPKTDQDVEVYTFLLELDDLLQDKSKNRERLTKALACESSNPPLMTVYLFDCHKEGSYVVKNNEQMQVMVGNALLALMEKDLARRVAAMHDPFEVAAQHSYYNSIGAAALVYDPESLQQACARKVAQEFLETEILSDVTDVQAAANKAAMVEKKLGDLRAWLEQCVFHLPPAVGQVRIDPDTNQLSVLLADLKLQDMDYEHVREISWIRQVKDFSASFEQEVRPQVVSVLTTNNQRLESELSEELETTIETLPIKPDLYPGGIKNALRTLEFLLEYLVKEENKIKKLQLTLQQNRVVVNQAIEEKLEHIQEILNHAPKLPWIIRILPKFARIWVTPIFYAHRYGKQIFQLQSLKDECLGLVQTQVSIKIQGETLIQILDFIPRIKQIIENGKNDYQALEKKVDAASQQLPLHWPAFPLGQLENGWDEIFRIPVVEQCLAEWGFAKWHPSFEKWIYEFLAEKSPFIDWRTISAEVIIEWLTSLGMDEYKPLWEVTLDEVFGLWEDNTSAFSSVEPVSPQLISKSMGSAFPLLRPDFDAVGGSRLSSISAHGLIGQPEWQHFKASFTLSRTNNLDLLYTSDPYSGLFLQIRHSVPLQSLADMIRSAKHRYSALPEGKKQEYIIINSQQDVIRPSSSDEIDPTNPDIVHKIFSWKFKPKGSGVEVEQVISLDISRSRFEHYRRMPRFKGNWNRYAEEEMTEIRSLASEFQRLHSNQKWSTYNQAFNILKFVQSCIPYSFDRDTTGFEDWARYPIETLMEGTGDCEDVAILCAAIIARLGFQTVLLLYPSHLAFGVAGADQLKGDYVVEPKTGKRYFYGEATANGWHLGIIPDSYSQKTPEEILLINILIAEE